MAGYIFGGEGMPKTPQALQRKRDLADALIMRNRAPQNVGEGLTYLGHVLAARRLGKRADKAEEAGRASANDAFSPILSALTQQNMAEAPSQPMTPANRVAQAFAAPQGLPPSLIQSESGGNFQASNNVPGSGGNGHFGRGQFSQGRLQDAMNAGVVPQGTTPQQFMADPSLQEATERWHVNDINSFISGKGLDDYVGKMIAGKKVTPQGMLAVAHLGGKGGLQKFLETGGQYNPADVNGTSLSDYLGSHANETVATNDAPQGMDIGALINAASNPFLSAGQKAVVSALLEKQMAGNDPMQAIELQKAQIELEQMRSPQPKATDDIREYQFAQQQGFDGTFQDYMTSNRKAGATNVNVGLGSDKYRDERDKQRAVRMGALQESEDGARRSMNALDIMDKAMKDPAFYSGAMANQVQFLKRVASGLGMDAEGIDSMETFNAMSKSAALDAIGGSLGSGFSNADRDFVIEQVPNLGNTPQGNQRLIEVQRKLAERKIQIAELARAYEARNGQIDNGFEQELSQWAESNPLFNKEPPPEGVDSELWDELTEQERRKLWPN